MTTKQKILLVTVAVIGSGIYGYELSYKQTGIDFFEAQSEIVAESQVEVTENTQVSTEEETIDIVLEEMVLPAEEAVSVVAESPETNQQEVTEETTTNASGPSLININTATLAELDTLPKIGEKRAQDIITYRDTNGGFQTIEDIMKVSGIADGIFGDIKDFITV